MPVMRGVSIAFIEVMRGVPLITVLFMASVMLPLFLPPGVNFDKLLRALVGVALFSAAYMAEVVRGGLQAIPKGQNEAAEALGLSYWKSMGLIILPQALKIVIPGIVNTLIGLFKDTTLVLIIGLFDLLGSVQVALTDANWIGFSREGYVFAALGYWIFCFEACRAIACMWSANCTPDTSARGDPMATDGARQGSDDAPIIVLRGVHKWYGQFHVLNDINLEVGKGQRIVVCGPSGSGKSTMIRCINRLEEHQRGEIMVDGIELTNDVRNIDAIRARSAWCFSTSTCSRI